jgi:hypothetical protein
MVCEESGGIYLFNQKQLFLYGENNDKVKQSAPTKGAQRAHNSLMLDYETSKWTLFPALLPLLIPFSSLVEDQIIVL